MVRDFCGHGLGRVFHDRPNILHYGEPGDGVVLEPGMLFTIEPMINLGKPHVKILADGWTAVTRDRELSAQFEHTVGVTETGCEVFTISPAGLHKPPYRSVLSVARRGRAWRRIEGPRRDGPEQSSLFKPERRAGSGYAGHRQRLKERFVAAGPEALPDYELLELVLFSAIPRRDTKPIAKRLIERFGSFAEAINAPPDA